jgi:hypothetical protein
MIPPFIAKIWGQRSIGADSPDGELCHDGKLGLIKEIWTAKSSGDRAVQGADKY